MPQHPMFAKSNKLNAKEEKTDNMSLIYNQIVEEEDAQTNVSI